jgi:hypothetical protein
MTATHAIPARQCLPNRRTATFFTFEAGDLTYTATYSTFADDRVAEVLLQNHKSNSPSDTNARDSAIVLSLALQHGADPDAIRRVLCRDFQGRASGTLGMALDAICGEGGR